MPTHFHSDHAAGLRAFVEAGARVVATPADSAYLAAMLRRRGSPPAAFDVVRDSARFGSGATAVVAHDLPHAAHTADNLFAWLPAPRLAFQGDLFYVDAAGALAPDRLPIMRDFVAFLDRRGIAPSVVWGMHGSVPAGPEHLERIRRGPR
jgi:glyoxylase-like metal-dependent hydrolase (beta-lactamase superfamily II)